jgi:Fic-DOC domain mobile mystery protein B
MTDPLFADDDGANTPLEAEEREQLIPSYITTRGELNEAEASNIADGFRWLISRRRDILDQGTLSELHKRMYGQVWKWAGSYRTTPRNIGIDAFRIPTELRGVIDDARYWVENDTFSPDEIAIRFSHRIVAIHPFPNGNGRLSRLVGDALVTQLGKERFTWGRVSLVDAGETRGAYVTALQTADNHDYGPLIAFARS